MASSENIPATTADSGGDSTYPDWLSSHDDNAIARLLWRLYANGSTSMLERFDSTATPETALHHLTALELAILHAASELGADSSPVSVDDICETLSELFDIAGTEKSRRPSRAEVNCAVRQLGHWGLLFGPALSLVASNEKGLSELKPLAGSAIIRMPAHLPLLFSPDTEHLWRLADCNRCSIPSDQLSNIIQALPPRQRRLLNTLAGAGGVGHSETVRPDANPDAPLPTMVRAGILDQLDDTTVRLSGRVASHMRGTIVAPPGGSFRYHPEPADESVGDATEDPRETAANDEAAIATVIQTIQHVSAGITDVAAHPVQPLSAGGIGLREARKIGRRRDIEPAAAFSELTLLHLCNFLAREFPDPAPEAAPAITWWSATDRAIDFLSAPVSTQWAMMLLGWSGSPYASWEAPEQGTNHLSPELTLSHAAELRALFSELFPGVSSTGAAAVTESAPAVDSSPHELLWSLRPALAARTSITAFQQLIGEATQLGLLTTGRYATATSPVDSATPTPTRAMRALRDVLRQRRCYVEAGEPPSESETLNALATRLESLLPPPVDMLIVQSDHTILAPGLLSSSDQQFLALCAEQESSGMASVWRVTKASLARAYASGATVESIEGFLAQRCPGGLTSIPQGLRYLIADTHRAFAEYPEDAGFRSPSRSVLHLVPTPRRTGLDPTASPDNSIYQRIEGAVEGFRRTHNHILALDPLDGSSSATTRTVRSTREIMTELRRVYSAGTTVRLHYVDYAGAITHDWVSVVMMTPAQLSVVSETTGESISVQPHRIAAVDIPGG